MRSDDSMRFLYQLSLAVLLFVPYSSYAQTPSNFSELVDVFLSIIDVLVLFVFGLALIVFLWGLMNAWILGAGDEEKIQKGKNTALVGIIVFVIMTGIWGILALFQRTLFGL